MRIDMITRTPHERYVAVPDRYDVITTNRFWLWVAKQAVKYGLVKGTYSCEVTYYTRVIDTEDLLEKIHLSRMEILRRYNVEAKKLIIGSDTFCKLQSLPVANTYFHLDFNVPDSWRFMGLEVCVVPWVEGMVLL